VQARIKRLPLLFPQSRRCNDPMADNALLTPEIRAEIRSYAWRCDDAELEAICDRASDRERCSVSSTVGRSGATSRHSSPATGTCSRTIKFSTCCGLSGQGGRCFEKSSRTTRHPRTKHTAPPSCCKLAEGQDPPFDVHQIPPSSGIVKLIG
jgi:hypothetical protein